MKKQPLIIGGTIAFIIVISIAKGLFSLMSSLFDTQSTGGKVEAVGRGLAPLVFLVAAILIINLCYKMHRKEKSQEDNYTDKTTESDKEKPTE